MGVSVDEVSKSLSGPRNPIVRYLRGLLTMTSSQLFWYKAIQYVSPEETILCKKDKVAIDKLSAFKENEKIDIAIKATNSLRKGYNCVFNPQ